jgi:hypothetical protein
MIIGLTHTRDGVPIQRLSVSTKIAVGLPPDKTKNRKAPVKLDYFIFQRRTNATTTLEAGWEIDPVLTKHYETQAGSKTPREIEVYLMNDDIDEVFVTKLAWWKATQCYCWGNGETATRRTAEHPKGEPWAPEHSPCGQECPDYMEGKCKPSGDLRFVLADYPKLGSIVKIHTSSYRSVMQIQSALQQIQGITKGPLAGIKASLVVSAEKTSYIGDDNSRHSTVVPIISLEIKAENMEKLVDKMTENAKLLEHTRKLLGGGHIQIVEDDETTLASELVPEFYHEAETEKPETRRTRQERERGVLEPGKQPNRGHDREGFGRKPAPTVADTFQMSEPQPIKEPEEQAPAQVAPEDQVCEVCTIPHLRKAHDGENGDGPCLECECPGFSNVPPPPRFDTAWANVAKEGAEPKWAELPRVTGKVVGFKNTDSNGAVLTSQQGKEFVIVTLHGLPEKDATPNGSFFDFHKSLFMALEMSLGEKIVMLYTPQKSGYQMVHDVWQIGANVFNQKKDGCHGGGIRGTIRLTDPLNQESAFKAEDESQW